METQTVVPLMGEHPAWSQGVYNEDDANPTFTKNKKRPAYRNDSGYASKRASFSSGLRKGSAAVTPLPRKSNDYINSSSSSEPRSSSEVDGLMDFSFDVPPKALEVAALPAKKYRHHFRGGSGVNPKYRLPSTSSEFAEAAERGNKHDLERESSSDSSASRRDSLEVVLRSNNERNGSIVSAAAIIDALDAELKANNERKVSIDSAGPSGSAEAIEVPTPAVIRRTSSDLDFEPIMYSNSRKSAESLRTATAKPQVPLGIAPVQDSYDEVDLEKSSESSALRGEFVEKSETETTTTPENAVPLSRFESMKALFYRTYWPQVDPELIMPSGPTLKEKYSYASTNRIPLYAAGVFSFASLTVGMWLFTVSSPWFSWFGVFCGALQIYMGISYFVGLVGKDFDLEGHKQILIDHPIDPETCPTVDIYLPVCKEPIEILANTWKYVAKMDYPADKLKVYVLDDGAMDDVKALAESYNFIYIVRGDRPRLKKAGNLRWAFSRTTGDFFNIYDADFCPREDFLRELIPRMMAHPTVAILQTPQFFRTRDEQTWVEQGAGAIQELFYRVIEVNRDRWGASICVGSNALYRRAALEEVGGTAEIGFSEDVHTGFGCVDRGWQVRYVPLCLACGVCPDSPRAFFSQQMRWCMGSTTLLSNPHFWKSNLTIMQKMCYLCGFLYYSAMALSIFLNPVPGIFMVWLRPEFFKYYNLAFALPSLLYTIIVFRFWAKSSYGLNVQYIQVIQSYAYLTAIKDRAFGRALQWAPSGDNKAHKNNKYRNMRILAWSWLFAWEGALIAGMIYQCLRNLAWYECIPLICLDSWNVFLAHRFLLCVA